MRRLRLVTQLALALWLASAGLGRAQAITVASKIDTEGALLGSIIALVLEDHGIAVTERLGLGPTAILRGAILAGEIDIYPEYTGNGARFFHREGDPVWRDPAAAFETVKRLDQAANDLVWLAPAPADNGWAIAVRKDLAAAESGGRLADFARYIDTGGKVRLAASAEFVESPGALPAFEHAYGFSLAERQLLVLPGGDTAATLRAAAEHISGVNAAMAYGTDGAIAALGLVILADDKHAQTVYQPAPVVRGAVLQRHPDLPALLDPVFHRLTLQRLQRLNAAIAVDGEDARTVARHFLADATQ